MLRHRLTLLTFLPGLLAAQTPASIEQAVHSIRATDVQRRLGIIADDSMLGRATPSLQLELVADTTLHPGIDVNLLPFGQTDDVLSGPIVLFAGPGDTLHPFASTIPQRTARDRVGPWASS